jgi:hypothetical protein
MSYYTKFADVEALLTSTTTATLASTDAVLVTSVSAGHPYQTTPGALVQAGGLGFVNATSLGTGSTGTNITNSGLTFLNSTAGTTSNWLLADPSAANQVKTIMFMSSTTSTNFSVNTVSASIKCTGSSSANMINFGSTATGSFVNFGQGVTMISQTTTSWIVVNVQRNPTAVSSGCVLAVGTGPIFTSV